MPLDFLGLAEFFLITELVFVYDRCVRRLLLPVKLVCVYFVELFLNNFPFVVRIEVEAGFQTAKQGKAILYLRVEGFA